jgi:hypothetical protein
MPACSKQQLKYIFAMRRKYKNKKSAPKHMKWVFNKDWTHDVKVSGLPTKVKSFQTYVSENYDATTKK